MTATETGSVTPVTSTSTSDTRRFNSRRFLLPIGAAMLIIVITLSSALIEAPYPGRDAFLSPISDAGHGSSTLADRLNAAGVDIDRRTDASDTSGIRKGTTLFVTAPDYLKASELGLLMEQASRIVLVMPPPQFHIGLQEVDDRVVAKTVDPGANCGLPDAVNAGPASARQIVYAPERDPGWSYCYDGGLAYGAVGRQDIIIMGTFEPFTNDHIDTAGNSALATSLLGQTGHITWIDDHESPPYERLDLPELPEGEDYEAPKIPIPYELFGSEVDPVYRVLPQWLWAGLVGMLTLMVAVALWRGRRLGPTVLEPLPTTVPAAETAMGRARLYQRAGAHQRAFDAICSGSIATMRPIVRLSPKASRDELVAAFAAKSGWTTAAVEGTLSPPPIAKASDLTKAVHALDALVDAVQRTHTKGEAE